ncbi:MAG TPA: LacI family DNA-binding transcriptional regulator [Candidatus Angelobacter sp.]|nr:LacI family DNA-binding transcriptional regulator [Candidatus Angelobacter sp.]
MAGRKTEGRNVTLRDVAQKSGFSIATVSVVLNQAPLANYLSPQTKKHIERTARSLGYQPNFLARSLRNRKNRALGIVVFDLSDPFCTPILKGIENTVYQASYLSLLADAQSEWARFERHLAVLLGQRVEGLIIIANWILADINLLADLQKRDIPTVIIGRELRHSSIHSVLVDNEAGGHLALQHLYDLGHREIAFIRGPKMLPDSGRRWKGVRSFARSVGLNIDPRLVLDLPDLRTPNAGFEAGIRASEELLRRGRAFTAIMAFDDMTAMGCLRTLTHEGIKVPDKCSVIGFDDIAPAGLTVPALTTIRQPMEAMGGVAVSMIVDTVRAGAERPDGGGETRKMSPELVVRESTGSRRTT